MANRYRFNNSEIQLAIERTHGRSLSEIARYLADNDKQGRTITLEGIRVRLAGN